jgi:16S rRNA (guanine966-N2)-methyltransferase
MTRIVAGAAGGRRLAVPVRGTRPTADRVREALFSALDSGDGVAGRRFADLFAGSGAVGLEALSRGAAAVALVESGRDALAVIRRNVSTVGLPGAVVIADRVERWAAAGEGGWEVVFADPPYDLDDSALFELLTVIADRVMAPQGVIVVERAARGPALQWPTAIDGMAERRYGEAMLWYGRAAPVQAD